MLSVFTYEHREPGGTAGACGFLPPTAPSAGWPSRGWRVGLNDIEEEAGLPVTRPPDPTLRQAVAFAWAAGETFADVVEEEELSGATSCAT